MDMWKKVLIGIIILVITGGIVYGIIAFLPSLYAVDDEEVGLMGQEVSTATVSKIKEERASNPIAIEEVSDNRKPDEKVSFVSREENAEDTLPYYLKNFTFTRKSKKEITHAIPDIDKLRGLTSEQTNGQSVYDICVSLFPSSYDQVLQLCTVFIRKDTMPNEYLRKILLAYSVSDKVRGITRIEYIDGIMTCYDNANKKLTVDTYTGVVKNGNKEIVIDAEEIIDISKKLESDYGYISTEEENRRSEVAEEKAEKAKKEAKEAQAELAKQQAELAKNAGTRGRVFTDKNGTTTVFTSAEWAKLKSVWDYTGDGEAYIGHHTVSELRQLLERLP